MICNNCGRECDDSVQFCSECGAQLGMEFSYSEPPSKKLVRSFCDPLFMVACILITVAAVPFIGGGLNVLSVLFAIFMWIVYSKAKKGECDYNSMRCISGTTFALIVVQWVLVGCCAFLAIIALLGGELILELLHNNFDSIFGVNELIGSDIIAGFGIMFILAACIVAVVYCVLINVLVYKPAHNFAKSLYTSSESGSLSLERAGYVSTSLLVLGIIKAVETLGSVGSLVSFLQNGSLAASLIVLSIWLKNNFVKSN